MIQIMLNCVPDAVDAWYLTAPRGACFESDATCQSSDWE